MIRMHAAARVTLFGLLAAHAAFAQRAPDGMKFDVASIKPSTPGMTIRAAGGTPHMGMTISGSRMDFGGATPEYLIRMAYRLESYQISGPDWIARTRFDILANMPAGATKEQLPEMLRSLLTERFHLVTHRESREQNIFALVASSGAVKLKPAAPSSGPMDKPFPNGSDGRLLLRLIRTEDGDLWTVSKMEGADVV